jgi:hypothetical protein
MDFPLHGQLYEDAMDAFRSQHADLEEQLRFQQREQEHREREDDRTAAPAPSPPDGQPSTSGIRKRRTGEKLSRSRRAGPRSAAHLTAKAVTSKIRRKKSKSGDMMKPLHLDSVTPAESRSMLRKKLSKSKNAQSPVILIVV